MLGGLVSLGVNFFFLVDYNFRQWIFISEASAVLEQKPLAFQEFKLIKA